VRALRRRASGELDMRVRRERRRQADHPRRLDPGAHPDQPSPPGPGRPPRAGPAGAPRPSRTRPPARARSLASRDPAGDPARRPGVRGHRGRAGVRAGGHAGRPPLGPARPAGRAADRQPVRRRGPQRRRRRRRRRGRRAGQADPARGDQPAGGGHGGRWSPGSPPSGSGRRWGRPPSPWLWSGWPAPGPTTCGSRGTVWSALPFAVAVPIVPLFGYGAAGRFPAVLWWAWPIGALLAVATHLADALPDVERDRATGVRGLATRLGVGRAAAVAAACYAAAVAMALYSGLAAGDRPVVAGREPAWPSSWGWPPYPPGPRARAAAGSPTGCCWPAWPPWPSAGPGPSAPDRSTGGPPRRPPGSPGPGGCGYPVTSWAPRRITLQRSFRRP
jgi:hypothetical protein